MAQCKHNHLVFKDEGKWCKDCQEYIPETDEVKIIDWVPNVVLGHHASTFDKMKYYGVKDARTGEGITKDTDVRDPVGITKKNKKGSRGKK